MAAMVLLLLSVGGAGVMASLFALGFGFANNGFDLGNTLINAGASGLGSSLVLIALAVVVRELRHLADTQPARLAGRGLHASEPADAQATAPRAAVGQRVPYPPKPMPEPPGREPRVADPRGRPEFYDELETERGRPNVFAATRGSEPPPAVEPDLAPLAPTRTTQPHLAPPPQVPPIFAPPQAPESPYEAKFGPADILARLGGGRAKPDAARDLPHAPAADETATEPAARYEPAEPPRRPEPVRSGRGGTFESMWPMEKPARPAEADAGGRVPKPEPRPEPKFEPEAEPKYEPKFEPKRPRPEPPPLQSAVVTPPPAAPAPAAPPEARTASILKSGVIDGMAYTLYTDGSIEAQLPQGTVHFASIEELRLHLERNG
jgi:hypothetical protein